MTVQLLATQVAEPEDKPPLYVTWHSVDLRSGRRGEELWTESAPALSRELGQPRDTSATVRIFDTELGYAENWDAATLPGRTVLVAVDERDEPLWGGMVLRRRSDSGPTVRVDLVTLEAYLDRRYIGDHEWLGQDEASVIFTGLIGDVLTDGVPFLIDAPATGRLRDRGYYDLDNRTALSALTELMEVKNGLEFTVDLAWADETHKVLQFIIRARLRIGRASATPEAVFEMPGSVLDFDYIEDYSSEHGANRVTAYSSGQGSSTPASSAQIAQDLIDGGWVRFDHRYTPAANIRSETQLDAHAEAEAAAMRNGLLELQLEAHAPTAPRIGQQFDIGDDVKVSLTCTRFPQRTDASNNPQPGFEAVTRCIGWELDPEAQILRPRLLAVG